MSWITLERKRGVARDTVILIGHPDDGALARAAGEELLEAYDCRVLLSRGDETPAERGALRRQLKEAGLVALVATSRYFEEENAARSLLLPLAREEKLRILAIADAGDAFERASASGSALARYEADYERRLRAYVEDCVDIGSAPAVAPEMDGPFALSVLFTYDERDEIFASRILPWFHSSERTCDVALCSRALPESLEVAREADMAFLLVTPALLEDMDGAKRLNSILSRAEKPLIAIVPDAGCTDALLESLPDVRRRVIPADPAAIHRMIGVWRERLGVPYRELSAFDRYRLAEAYQAGRGTQRDMAQAREMYASSAEDGCVWAMLRLGVDPAEERREHWLRGAIPRLRQLLYETTPRAEEAAAVGRGAACALEHYVAMLMEKGEYASAEESLGDLSDAVKYLRQVGWRSDRFEMDAVYVPLGDISLARGDLAEAERWYRQAEALLRPAKRTSIRQIDFACLLEKLSEVYGQASDGAKSDVARERQRSTLEEALDIFMELNRLRSWRFWRDSARVCNRLLKVGILCEESGDGAWEARQIYNLAAEALGEVRQYIEEPILEEQYATALCYSALAAEGAPERSRLYEAHRVFKALTDRYPHSEELNGKLEYVTHCLTIWPRFP